MENIRRKIQNYFENKKIYLLIKTVDEQILLYIKGILINMIIQFFEYTFLFFIIGHPSFLLLGFLFSITNIIPIFGNLFSSIIAIITAFVISKKVFILTVVIIFIFSNIDSYIISPKVYNKTNKLPFLLSIVFIFIGSLFGIFGILLSIPVLIIIMSILNIYKNDIKKIIINKTKL